MQKASSRYVELEGLRGLLALWVMVAHVLCWTGILSIPGSTKLSEYWSILVSAQPAVDIFIILSGFAIATLLATKQLSYKQFIVGRIFRIYPVYLFCLALAVMAEQIAPRVASLCRWQESSYFSMLRPVFGAESSNWGEHILWHLTLLNGLVPSRFLPHAANSIFGPGWSLTLEWQFYLVAPLVCSFFWSRHKFIVIASLFGAEIAGKFIYDYPTAFLATKLPLFFLGVASFHCLRSQATPHRLVPLMVSYRYAAFAIIVAFKFGNPAVSLATWVVVFLAIKEKDPSSNDPSRLLAAIRTVLTKPIIQRLGKYSYPLYLVHWPLITAFLYALLRWQPEIRARHAAVLVLSVGGPLIVTVAGLLHHFLEKPLMDYGRRISGRATSPAP